MKKTLLYTALQSSWQQAAMEKRVEQHRADRMQQSRALARRRSFTWNLPAGIKTAVIGRNNGSRS